MTKQWKEMTNNSNMEVFFKVCMFLDKHNLCMCECVTD